MTLARRLRRARDGATTVEFALLAPLFFFMLFGLIEGGRLYWTSQTISEVAYSTARCMTIASTCATTAQQKTFAVNRAKGYGLKILSANVTPASATTCRGQSNSNSVAITASFSSVLRGFLPMPTTLHASACFPVLS